jgi:surfeit locus 1 family protein
MNDAPAPNPVPGFLPLAQMRWPIIPTTLVGLAIATMIALGIWQLDRKGEKEAMIALHQRNAALTEEVAFPELGPVDPALYFRRSRVTCLSLSAGSARGAKDERGATVWQMVADCRTGAEGPGAIVAVGTDADPMRALGSGGAAISGIIVPGPGQPGLLARLTGGAAPARPMLVADPPIATWGRNPVPSPEDAPNNHLAYAGQWFLFAIAAGVIYVLALRRRLRG